MARIDTLTNYLSDVAEAIKTKKGDDTPILASEFDTEITNLPSGGSSRDWSAIGYNGEPKSFQEMFGHSKEIYDNWNNTIIDLNSKFSRDKKLVWFPLVDTSNVKNMTSMFYYCTSLKEIPQFDTSNVTNMNYMFNNCTSLEEIPQFDTSNVTAMKNMFQYCNKLTDTSIDNILQFCITSKIENGTLQYLGFKSNVYPINRIEALPHYQDFLDAGWTIGY
jgi:surface protein